MDYIFDTEADNASCGQSGYEMDSFFLGGDGSHRSSETDWIPDALPAPTDPPPKPETDSGRQRKEIKRGSRRGKNAMRGERR